MNPGRQTRQITIERKQVTLDPEYGTQITTWVPLVAQAGSPTIAERFDAEVQDILPSRSEAVLQGLAQNRLQTRLRMRWRDDVDSSMRVTVHGDTDRIYSIISGPVEFGGRKEQIEMVLERYSS